MSRISAVSAQERRIQFSDILENMMSAYSNDIETYYGNTFGFSISKKKLPCFFMSPKAALILDGVIYNSQELAVETGIKSANDVEILNALIEKFGVIKALSKLNGDYAVIYIDHVNNFTWAARDPMGMRPLYYSFVPDIGIIFSSQPGGILKSGLVSSEADEEYLVRYGAMHYRMIDNELKKSPYKYISQCEAGVASRFDSSNKKSHFKFFDISNEADYEGNEENLAKDYQELLLDAVSIRLKKFSNPAFTLSGGMDSSSVLACASKIGGKQIAYSCLYEDKTYDEREEIIDMLSENVSDWRQVIIPDDIDIVSEIDQLIKIHDEPVATGTWLSHRKLCESAGAQGFNAIFGGLGGDELNAGEYEYFPMHFADLQIQGKTVILENEINHWVKNHNHPVFAKSPVIANELIKRLVDLNEPGKCLPDLQRLMKYQHVIDDSFLDIGHIRPTMEIKFSSYLKNRTWQDLTRETIPCCIRAEDRHGAYYGLPPVLPFLDKRLVDFMYKVPGSLKIKNGVTKVLLRRAMMGILPEKTRVRVKKTGWNAPAHVWFIGQGANNLRDLVNSDDFRSLGLYRKDVVLDIIDEHENIVRNKIPKENHMMFLWQLLNLIRWNKYLKQLKKI
jgi:asparagine synthase (glutamine-hydrolysing)